MTGMTNTYMHVVQIAAEGEDMSWMEMVDTEKGQRGLDV